MKTIREVILSSLTFVQQNHPLASRRQIEEIIAATLDLRRIDLYTSFDKPLQEKELAKVRPAISRFSKGEPIQYILEQVSFYNVDIAIDKRVLIPRNETELLVEKVACDLACRSKNQRVLDLCTGSGCIIIAIKKSFPDAECSGIDISSAALEVAKKNARHNEVDISFVHGDLFEPYQGKKADLIVSNPPYIKEADYIDLDPSVRDFEPKLALVSGVTGLEFYKRIRSEIQSIIAENGIFWCEIGLGQIDEVTALFSDIATVTPHKDYLGVWRFCRCLFNHY